MFLLLFIPYTEVLCRCKTGTTYIDSPIFVSSNLLNLSTSAVAVIQTKQAPRKITETQRSLSIKWKHAQKQCILCKIDMAFMAKIWDAVLSGFQATGCVLWWRDINLDIAVKALGSLNDFVDAQRETSSENTCCQQDVQTWYLPEKDVQDICWWKGRKGLVEDATFKYTCSLLSKTRLLKPWTSSEELQAFVRYVQCAFFFRIPIQCFGQQKGNGSAVYILYLLAVYIIINLVQTIYSVCRW